MSPTISILSLTASLLFFLSAVDQSECANFLPCPQWNCTLGSYFDGKFLKHDSTTAAVVKGPKYGVLQPYYFDAYSFGDDFPTITNGELGNCQLACAEACQNLYNAKAVANGLPLATYWMFEQTCSDGPGGECLCMSQYACNESTTTTGWWSDEYIEGWVYGVNFAVPTTYTTGAFCPSNIHGDPHFTGADGSHFEFSGIPNNSFAIVSDAHLQINAYLGGRWGQWDARTKAMTWIRQVAVMWGHHVALFSARSGPSADYGTGYMSAITVDGELVDVPPHSTTTAADGFIAISWVEVKKLRGSDFVDVYEVAVGGVIKFRLLLRPEMQHLRTREDGIVHFSIMVDQAKLSSNAHGVLGQTYRPDFAGRLSRQHLVRSNVLGTDVVPGDNAEGFLDGQVDDYLVKDLFKADCRFCRFVRGTSIDEETTQALALSSAVSYSSRMGVSRRLLGTEQ